MQEYTLQEQVQHEMDEALSSGNLGVMLRAMGYDPAKAYTSFEAVYGEQIDDTFVALAADSWLVSCGDRGDEALDDFMGALRVFAEFRFTQECREHKLAYNRAMAALHEYEYAEEEERRVGYCVGCECRPAPTGFYCGECNFG